LATIGFVVLLAITPPTPLFTKRIYLGVCGCWIGNHPTSAWNYCCIRQWLLIWQPPLMGFGTLRQTEVLGKADEEKLGLLWWVGNHT
jgi:hypothetical protein